MRKSILLTILLSLLFANNALAGQKPTKYNVYLFSTDHTNVIHEMGEIWLATDKMYFSIMLELEEIDKLRLDLNKQTLKVRVKRIYITQIVPPSKEVKERWPFEDGTDDKGIMIANSTSLVKPVEMSFDLQDWSTIWIQEEMSDGNLYNTIYARFLTEKGIVIKLVRERRKGE